MKKLLLIFCLIFSFNNIFAVNLSRARRLSDLNLNTTRVYMFNLGTQRYLNVGGEYGAQLMFSEVPMPVSFDYQSYSGYSADNGYYFLRSNIQNGNDNDYFYRTGETRLEPYGDGSKNDAVLAHIYLHPTESYAANNVYYVKSGQRDDVGNEYAYWLAYNHENYVVSILPYLQTAEDAMWIFLTEEDLKEELNQATRNEPIDATFLIKQQNLERHSKDNDAWEWTNNADGGSHAIGVAYDGNDSAERIYGQYYNAEIYNRQNDGLFQQIHLIEGTYILSCQGFYRNGGPDAALNAFKNETEEINAYLFWGSEIGSNGHQTPLKSIFYGASVGTDTEFGYVGLQTELGYIPNNLTQSGMYFSFNRYPNTLSFYVAEEGDYYIGVGKNGDAVSADWVAFDNFRLTYYGHGNTVEPNDPQIPAGETYYLYNVKTGTYVNQGGEYGSEAVLTPEGGLDMIYIDLDNGKHELATNIVTVNRRLAFVPNHAGETGNRHLFTDGIPGGANYYTDFTTDNGDGEGNYIFIGFTDENNNIWYLQANKEGTGLSFASTRTDELARWRLVTRQEREEELNPATTTGQDATFYIEDPDFGWANMRQQAWKVFSEEGHPGSTQAFPLGDEVVKDVCWLNYDNFSNKRDEGKYEYAAMNNTDYVDVTQSISGMKPGVYILSCQGFYRDNYINIAANYWNNTDGLHTYKRRAFLMARTQNGETMQRTALKAIFEGEGITPENAQDLVNAYSADNDGERPGRRFSEGRFLNQLPIVVGEDGTLVLGISKPTNTDRDWVAFDSFRLTYLGTSLTAYQQAFAIAKANATATRDSFAPHAQFAAQEYTDLNTAATLDEPGTIEGLSNAITQINTANSNFDESAILYDSYLTLKSEKQLYTLELYPYASKDKYNLFTEKFADDYVPTSISNLQTSIRSAKEFVESNALAEGVEGSTANIDVQAGRATIEGMYPSTQIYTNRAFKDLRKSDESKIRTYSNWYTSGELNTVVTQEIGNLQPGKYIITISLRAGVNLEGLTLSATQYHNEGDEEIVENYSVREMDKMGAIGGIYGNGWYDCYNIVNISTYEDHVRLQLTAHGISGATGGNWFSLSNQRIARIEAADEFFLDEDATLFSQSTHNNARCILHRTLNKDCWNSITLPVSLSYRQFQNTFGEDAKLGTLEGLNPSRPWTIVFKVKEANVDDEEFMRAGEKYIIKPTKDPTATTGIYTSKILRDESNQYLTINAPYYKIDNVSLTSDFAEGGEKQIPDATIGDGYSAGVFAIKFMGTYFRRANSGEYAISSPSYYAFYKAAGNDESYLYHFTSPRAIKGFNCWIEDVDGQLALSGKTLSIEVDSDSGTETTQIEGFTTTNAQSERMNIYTLDGRKIASGSTETVSGQLPKGIYIVNGKKVVIK